MFTAAANQIETPYLPRVTRPARGRRKRHHPQRLRPATLRNFKR
jgi:hypothetical protein